MESKFNDNLLTIKLCNRIDTNNALKVEEEIFSIINSSNGVNSLVLDANELEYISSAGLRLILKLKKTIDNFKIINVSNDVYETFDMTGFSEIMDISKRFRELDVSNAKIIGEGAKGIVYRYSDELIVKVYKHSESIDEINREHELARKAFILGIPTALSFSVCKVGDKFATVFELLDATSVTQEIANNKSSLDKWAKISADLLKQIHSTPIKEGEVEDNKYDVLRRLLNLKDALTEEEYQKLEKMINDVPDCHFLIHGDFHTNNIMVQNGEVLLIDMDTLAMGNPVFELANVYIAYVGFGIFDPKKVENFLKLDYETAKIFFDKFINYYMPDYNEDVLNKLKLLSYMRFYHHIKKRNKGTEEEINNMNTLVKFIKELLTKVDKLSL